jgi:hypothetical protein
LIRKKCLLKKRKSGNRERNRKKIESIEKEETLRRIPQVLVSLDHDHGLLNPHQVHHLQVQAEIEQRTGKHINRLSPHFEHLNLITFYIETG